MSDYPQLVEEYQRVMSENQNFKQSIKAMDARIGLKNDQIQVLTQCIQKSKQTLSLQIHAIKDMQKPLLIDPSINAQFNQLRNNMETLQNEYANQQSVQQSYSGKQFTKGGKMLDKWMQNTDEISSSLDQYAHGRIQDLHLQLSLSQLRVQELKGVLDEYKNLVRELEKESIGMNTQISTLQQQYKTSLDHLEQLKQENSRLKRNNK